MVVVGGGLCLLWQSGNLKRSNPSFLKAFYSPSEAYVSADPHITGTQLDRAR